MFTNVAGTLFFAAGDRRHGNELWRSDGTRRGTRMVKDIRPGPRPCAASKGACRSQGATSYPSGLTAVGRTLYFTADDGIHGSELWRSDGTARGTRLVKDMNPGAGAAGLGQPTDVAGTLFFTASDGTHSGLWRSDGSAAGTTLVKEMFSSDLTAVGRTLYFVGNGGLWRSGRHGIRDGAGQGIQGESALWHRPLLGSPTWQALSSSPPTTAPIIGLWRSDGTEAGTTLVKEGVGAIGRTAVGSILYFTALTTATAGCGEATDEAGTTPITSVGASPQGDGLWPEATDVDGILYFVRSGGGFNGTLLRTDGTPSGTRELRGGMIPGSSPRSARPSTSRASTRSTAMSSGKATAPRGTRLVRDIRRGERSAEFQPRCGGKTLFFSASDGVHGTELWRAGAKPRKKGKPKRKKG